MIARRTRRSALVPQTLWLACGAIAACQAPQAAIRNEAPLSGSHREIASDAGSGHAGTFTLRNHQVFVPVSINGTAAGWALLDTGANACALHQPVADRIGIRPSRTVTVQGTAGQTQADFALLTVVSVFGAAVRDVDTTIYELGCVGPDGQPIALILGYPFLRHFAVDLDYGKSLLKLHTTPIASSRGVPMRLDNGIPTLSARLDDRLDVTLRIDTGASLFDTPDAYLNITSHMLSALRTAGARHRVESRLKGTGVGGTVELPVVRLDSAKLGVLTIERPFAIVQPAVGAFENRDAPGFVGNYTLSTVGRVVFDYLDETLDVPDAADVP